MPQKLESCLILNILYITQYKNYNDFYTEGEYYSNNPTWDTEDSAWKAKQLFDLFKKENIKNINFITEVGCGAGKVLYNFSKFLNGGDIKYIGYDISPQAIELANDFKKEKSLDNFEYKIGSIPDVKSDLLLCVNVFEHIEDEFNFLRLIKAKSKYFLFNIPLDLSLQSLIRENVIPAKRKRISHINYYTKKPSLENIKRCQF